MANEALEQARESIKRYGESIGCELLSSVVRREPQAMSAIQAQYFRDLDSDAWAVRESAFNELFRTGADAVETLIAGASQTSSRPKAAVYSSSTAIGEAVLVVIRSSGRKARDRSRLPKLTQPNPPRSLAEKRANESRLSERLDTWPVTSNSTQPVLDTVAEASASPLLGRLFRVIVVSRHVSVATAARWVSIEVPNAMTEPGPIRKILTHLGEPLAPPPVSPARGPPTNWGELVQVHDDREAAQVSPDEVPAIDIHSL